MIYLDYNATTPCDPSVVQAMLPYFTEKFGNAASTQHTFGWIADEAVKTSRTIIARSINCTEQEIVFTSGATESCNLAIKGVYHQLKTKGKHIITVSTEHKAVLDTCMYLQDEGAEITILPVDNNGLIDTNALQNAIRPDTILVAVMFANNETGIIQNVKSIGDICKINNIIFFTDATQAFGKIAIDVSELHIDLMAFSAHKIYGPKGIGGLYVRRKNPRVSLFEQINGGGHERGRRSGTLNVPGIVGLGKAIAIYEHNRAQEWNDLTQIRDTFEIQLQHLYPNIIVHGNSANRLAHVSNIAINGIAASKLIATVKFDLAIAVGSACSSNNNQPSHVLSAMHLTKETIASSIRISFGRDNSLSQIPTIIKIIDSAIKAIKES